MQNLNAVTIPFWKIDVVVKFHGPILLIGAAIYIPIASP